jgi:hypothetical protein
VAISVSVHAAALGLLFLGTHFTWTAPPIPIEVQPMHHATQKIGEERRGDPRAQEPKPQPAPRPHGAGEKHAEPTPRPAPAPPSTSDLKPYAPDDANLVVLLRSDKLRKSPYRPEAEQLLGALPDYSTLLGGTGLSPIDDFEALLIATANPRDVTATFLAARFVDSPRVRAIGDRPLHPGDPRVFRFPLPGLAVLAHPDEALRLDGAADAGAGDPRGRWLKQLAEFDRAAAIDGGPAVLVTLSDAPALLRFGDGLPTPQTLALALTAEASPALRLRAAFATDEEAARMEREWPAILQRYRSNPAIAFTGLAPALDDLKLSRKGAELSIQGRIPESQTRLALSWVVRLLPHASAPDAGE